MDLERLAVTTAQQGFTDRNDPFALFAEWMKDAEKSEPNDPNAMSLATVDEEGLPNVRMVLLKDYDDKGFVFYTNYLKLYDNFQSKKTKRSLLVQFLLHCLVVFREPRAPKHLD